MLVCFSGHVWLPVESIFRNDMSLSSLCSRCVHSLDLWTWNASNCLVAETFHIILLVHSVWTRVGWFLQNDYCFLSLQWSFSVPSLLSRLMLFAGSAFARSHVGLELPFAALAGGVLGLISPCLLLPAVPLSLPLFFFYLPPLWDSPHSLMNFSLCYILGCSLYIASLSLPICLFLLCACLTVCVWMLLMANTI